MTGEDIQQSRLEVMLKLRAPSAQNNYHETRGESRT
jgi:hypothetical protein